MTLSTPFINDAGRLRSGWRIVIFIIVFLGVIKISDLLVLRINWAGLPRGYQLLDLLSRILLLVAAFIAGYRCAHLIEDLPWRSLGLTLKTRWFYDLILGSIIG